MGTFLKKSVSCVLVAAILSVGCAGREALPMASHHPNDSHMGCDALRDEISYLRVSYDNKKKEFEVKEALDIVFFITGWLVIVPFFFMDLKDAEKVEYQAIDHRIEVLTSIAREKNCPFVYGQQPD